MGYNTCTCIIYFLYIYFSYFCKGPRENEVNLVSQMETSGLWADILGARNIVAHHVSSLIYNVNNNVVEGFNNVIAKYVGGKRINFSLRGMIILKKYHIVSKYYFFLKILNYYFRIVWC